MINPDMMGLITDQFGNSSIADPAPSRHGRSQRASDERVPVSRTHWEDHDASFHSSEPEALSWDSPSRRQRTYSRDIETDFSQGERAKHARVRDADSHLKSSHAASAGNRETKFLRAVQDELEDQRSEWKKEVDRMTKGIVLQNDGLDVRAVKTSGVNSYVDTASGSPVFRAFVEVKDFPPSCITVTVDKLQNKVIVNARKEATAGKASRSFTQKVQLPKYADDQYLRSRVSQSGILNIEVPLLYYFKPEKKVARSFVNQVTTDRDGNRTLEILVNIGSGFRPWDLKVQVIEDRELRISGCRDGKKKTIKRYQLPELAETGRINSRLGEDGRLIVAVPLMASPAPSPLQ